MKKPMMSVVAALSATLSFGGLVAAPVLLTPTPAHAQRQGTVGTLLSGLVNVNVQNVDVDVVDVIDVSDVLNDNKVDILRNAIQNNPIASNNQDFLNNLLREADIITDNETVIGILNGVLVVADVL
jgi:hypothetical protein